MVQGVQPNVLSKLASDFNARSTRPQYPSSHTLFWE